MNTSILNFSVLASRRQIGPEFALKRDRHTLPTKQGAVAAPAKLASDEFNREERK
jgi:hypothetical protein